MTAPVASALMGSLDALAPASAKDMAVPDEAFDAVLSAFFAASEEAVPAGPASLLSNSSAPVPQESLPRPSELEHETPPDTSYGATADVAQFARATPPAPSKIAVEADGPAVADAKQTSADGQDSADESDDDNAPSLNPAALPALPINAQSVPDAPQAAVDAPDSDETVIAAVEEDSAGDTPRQFTPVAAAMLPDPAVETSDRPVSPVESANAAPAKTAPVQHPSLPSSAIAGAENLFNTNETQPPVRPEKSEGNNALGTGEANLAAKLASERPVSPAPIVERPKDAPRHVSEAKGKAPETVSAPESSDATPPAIAETPRAMAPRAAGEAPLPSAAADAPILPAGNVPHSNVAFSQTHNALLDAVVPQISQPMEASAHTAQPLKFDVAASSSGSSDEPTPMDALALRIATHSANGERNFSIRLDPPELGRVEVNLTMTSDGDATAQLRAEKPQTLELLQKDASALERALKDAGLNLSMGLAFSLKGDGRPGAWRDAQSFGRGRNLQIAGVDTAANSNASNGAALAARAYGLSAARLDIRV